MSQGQPWIDRVMAPLGLWGDIKLPAEEYNRVYEAVGRGDERQGAALVAAIVSAIQRGPVAQPESEGA